MNYTQLDNRMLIQQHNRLSNNIKIITLKKLQMAIQQFNQQRLKIAQVIRQLDKRKMLQKPSEDITAIPIRTLKKDD